MNVQHTSKEKAHFAFWEKGKKGIRRRSEERERGTSGWKNRQSTGSWIIGLHTWAFLSLSLLFSSSSTLYNAPTVTMDHSRPSASSPYLYLSNFFFCPFFLLENSQEKKGKMRTEWRRNSTQKKHDDGLNILPCAFRTDCTWIQS